MEEIVVYVHGKGGSAQEAEHYKALFPDCEVIGFDYHAQSPWEATEEFSGFFTAVRKRCGKLTLVANSIGAFLSLSSLNEKLVDTACFISPVVDMEQLICNMMQWADVSEAELAEKLPEAVVTPLEGTYLCWINLEAYVRADEMKEVIQKKCRLAVDFGDWFGGERFGTFIRMNLATSKENVEIGVNALIANLVRK